MTKMIDRLKRVANETYQTFGQSGHLRTQALSDPAIEAMVFAILDEMREPTTAMVDAAGRLNHPRDVEIYRAMIDAARDIKS